MSLENIKKLRKIIDDIDNSILQLLKKRGETIIEIGNIKRLNNMSFYSPSREKEIYERLTALNTGPYSNDVIKSIFREIISASLSLEQPVKVVFLGPRATFTHLACIQRFGLSTDLIPKKNISDVFDEVERGHADYGVVPIENSNEGIVSHTLDMFIDSKLKICSEILLRVSHNLLSKTGRFEDIVKVYSHPQAIAQCRKWLEKNLPGIAVFDVSSTAEAAQIASDDISCAAIASESAGILYDLKTVRKNIEDNINNFTRFLVISPNYPDRTGDDKTSIMFSVKDEAGILYKILEPFAKRGINLSKIESRPMKTKPWEYIFFLDIDGHISEEKIKEAISVIKEHCIFLKVLGSYPKGILNQ